MKRTHIIDGKEITIDWERDCEIENHGSGCVYWGLSGLGSDGNEYIATGVYQYGELEEIQDIELS